MSVPDVLPPSPPTTNHRERIRMSLTFKPDLCTPDENRDSFIPSSGASGRKRVEFSPWPNVVDGMALTPSSQTTALKALPPSKECQSSTRSILKPYVGPVTSTSSLDAQSEIELPSPETIETIAKQLAANDKGSSIDAYQILSQMIKAYDEIPEDVNTRAYVASILRSIKRDLSIQDHTQSSPIDTNVMTQALKVSVIFVWSEHLSPLLTDDFRVFIIDRSIAALAEHSAPKIIIIHYMHLLAMQNFRSGILSSNNRAVRLLEALQDITEHVQGKGAVSERLLIYHKLIDQVRPIMKTRVGLWMKEVILALSSSVKDIRDKAISIGTKACAAFPSSPTVSTAAREALSSTMEDRSGNSKTLSVILTQRLEKMVAAKDEASQVPQIWALGMLLCNSVDARLENWSLLRDWLMAIQRCFNCSDMNVRAQAFPAWNRFIYITRPHEASDVMVSMLAKPIISQMERSSMATSGKGTRPPAVSSYCMLLYYAFRPAASHKQYTRMWNEYIVKIMGSKFLSRSTANADLCCRVIMSLMWKEHTASRVWNENRAHENTLMDPEELPLLDCKWTRSKTEAILHLLKLLFHNSVWGPSLQHSDQAYVAKAWRHFLKAIKESASKEIKQSVDTKKAISHIIEFVRDFQKLDSTSAREESMARSRLISYITVAELGSLALTEPLEAIPELRSPALLTELLRNTMKDHVASGFDQTKAQRSSSSTTLSSPTQRCAKMLDVELQKAYDNDAENRILLREFMSATSKTLKSLHPESILAYLTLAQASLVKVLEDQKAVAKSLKNSDPLLTSWIDLSVAVSGCVSMLSIQVYKHIDGLLAAMLLSPNLFTSNLLLKNWSDSVWEIGSVSYGPMLNIAIEKLRSQVDIDLPGIERSGQDPVSQIQRITHENSLKPSENDSAMQKSWQSPTAVVDELVFNHTQAVPSTFADVASTTSNKKRPALRRLDRKLRHDDSQIQFMPVDSSPVNIDDIDSQLLTSRQKDVRDRQRAEQTVTFQDLRFSPRPHSSRENRATSTDCEMARKAAAMSVLPATPTLNRHNDNMDEAELPSPTPKARHKTIQMVEIDIPSSPPSVIGNSNMDASAHDLPSSPPKGLRENDANMVDLDDANLNTEKVNVVQDGMVEETDQINSPMQNESRDVDTFEGLNSVVQETLHSHAKFIDTSSQEADRTSNGYETAQEVVGQVENHCTSERTQGNSHDEATYSDEIDELSASQLSQSLDWHIAEEARHSMTSADQEEPIQTAQKRRKRTVSGYADRDGKKRRKRTSSSNTASTSSFASDDPVQTSANADDNDVEDCIVVSISSSVRDGKHSAPRAVEEASPSTPTGRRGRSRQRRGQHMADEVGNSDGNQHREVTNAMEPNASQEIRSSPMEIRTRRRELFEDDAVSTYQKLAERVEETVNEDTTPVVNKSAAEVHTHNDTLIEEQTALTANNSMNVMTALQTALNNLKSAQTEHHGDFDLKAIEDLCFQIRFQAQEIVQGRKHG